MPHLDTSLLEHILVDFAAGEDSEHVGQLVGDLLLGPRVTAQACLGVMVATVKVASDAGLLPASTSDEETFYGLTIDEHHADEPEYRVAARTAAMRALVAGLNNEWDTAQLHLAGPLNSSLAESTSVFHQLLIVWRAVVNTPEGAIAVQLLGPFEVDDDDAPV